MPNKKSTWKKALPIAFLGAVLALLADTYLSLRVAREYDRLITETVGSTLDQILDTLSTGTLSSANGSGTSQPEVPRDRFARLTLIQLTTPELRQRPLIPKQFAVREVSIYNLNAAVGANGYLMDIECEGTTPRWWTRRTNLTLRTNERQHTLWGFYCFGGLLATNWNRGDGGLEEAFQRPVARYESPYRFQDTLQSAVSLCMGLLRGSVVPATRVYFRRMACEVGCGVSDARGGSALAAVASTGGWHTGAPCATVRMTLGAQGKTVTQSSVCGSAASR